jgi:hypothetical protein
MTTFSETISTWETFYLLAGTAAATLMGLLFVAVSININAFHKQLYADLQLFATLTFNCFFYVLLISIMFLIPELSPLGLGIPLFLLGGLGLANAILQQGRAKRLQSKRGVTSIASRFNLPIYSLLGLAIMGMGVIFKLRLSLYGLVFVIVFLLASASLNAWILLVRADKQEKIRTDPHK